MCQKTKYPHIKHILLVDMIARACKNIFSGYQKDSDASSEFEEFTIDYLNLIFGKGAQSEIFWNQYLRHQVMWRFEYDIKGQKKVSLK